MPFSPINRAFGRMRAFNAVNSAANSSENFWKIQKKEKKILAETKMRSERISMPSIPLNWLPPPSALKNMEISRSQQMHGADDST